MVSKYLWINYLRHIFQPHRQCSHCKYQQKVIYIYIYRYNSESLIHWRLATQMHFFISNLRPQATDRAGSFMYVFKRILFWTTYYKNIAICWVTSIVKCEMHFDSKMYLIRIKNQTALGDPLDAIDYLELQWCI